METNERRSLSSLEKVCPDSIDLDEAAEVALSGPGGILGIFQHGRLRTGRSRGFGKRSHQPETSPTTRRHHIGHPLRTTIDRTLNRGARHSAYLALDCLHNVARLPADRA